MDGDHQNRRCVESMDILVIEDDGALRKLLCENLAEMATGAAKVHGREDVCEAVEFLKQYEVHGVLLDHRGNDIYFLQKITAAPVVILTGDDGAKRRLKQYPVYIKPEGLTKAMLHVLSEASDYFFAHGIPSSSVGKKLSKLRQTDWAIGDE
jgi:CheY-like chemotaxis protein